MKIIINNMVVFVYLNLFHVAYLKANSNLQNKKEKQFGNSIKRRDISMNSIIYLRKIQTFQKYALCINSKLQYKQKTQNFDEDFIYLGKIQTFWKCAHYINSKLQYQQRIYVLISKSKNNLIWKQIQTFKINDKQFGSSIKIREISMNSIIYLGKIHLKIWTSNEK